MTPADQQRLADPSDARYLDLIRLRIATREAWQPNQFHASDIAFLLRLLDEATAPLGSTGIEQTKEQYHERLALGWCEHCQVYHRDMSHIAAAAPPPASAVELLEIHRAVEHILKRQIDYPAAHAALAAAERRGYDAALREIPTFADALAAREEGYDAAKEQAAHYIENQTAGAIDPLWSGSVAAEGIRALKPDWLDANRPKKNA